MTKVVFLGAGASADAGYPLTSMIFDELAKEYDDSVFPEMKEDWKKFQDWRSDPDNGVPKIILEAKNPELIMTVPDLFQAALQDYDSEIPLIAEGSEYHFNNTSREHLEKAVHARNSLLSVLENYFLMKHYQDSHKLEPADYLNKMLINFDCVITTNWDTLAELTLMRRGLWTPFDGYGFRCSFQPTRRVRNNHGLKTKVFGKSTVKVLKLHGSIGWHRDIENKFYLRHDSFLQYLTTEKINNYQDVNTPKSSSGPHYSRIMLYPTFLKKLSDKEIISVWSEAHRVLRKARELTIIGYSLPEADVAIRALFSSLTPRRNLQIRVIDPSLSRSNQDKWTDIFGDKIDFVCKRASSYYGK